MAVNCCVTLFLVLLTDVPTGLFTTFASPNQILKEMKKVIIGALVGTVIYFGFQTALWIGGFHRNFYTYAAEQDTVLNFLSQRLPEEGMYMMPMADNQSPDFKMRQQELEKTMAGNPWVMVFFHPKMSDFSAATLILGILFGFIAAFIASFIMFMGSFPCFWSRFTVSMLFAVFALIQGAFSYMNWWEFPWSFIQPQVIDLAIGWGLTSVWLGWFVKPREGAE